jgi:hypothetical protein
MRQLLLTAAGLASICVLQNPVVAGGRITGDYVETRSADVYTGPCFANGEVGLTGNEAILAWKVRQGTWNGTALDGLGVVAVVKGNATLGDVYSNPYPAKAVLIVDSKASDQQKRALVEMAQSRGGQLLERIVRIQTAPISMEVGEGSLHGSVDLRAGDFASIQTRSLGDKDHFCGNEYTYYPPLTELSHAMPAFAIQNEYAGGALGSEWRIFNKRSAFVGNFTIDEMLSMR